MRKISLTKQLIIIFVLVFGILIALFESVVLINLESFYRDESLSRLSIYLIATSDNWSNDEHVVLGKEAPYKLAYCTGKLNTDTKSVIYDNFTNDYDVIEYDLLTNTIYEEFKTAEYDVIIKSKNNRNINYVYEIKSNGQFAVFFSNTEYSSYLKSAINKELINVFIITVLCAMVILVTWSRVFINRIKKIERNIRRMPGTRYLEEYIDNGSDEIGELSLNIDEMRREMKYNDHTKQEMLQNVSHDFKTPIAVIKNYAEAIQDDMDDPQESAKIILAQTDVLKNKVETLLQYNRLEYLKHDKEFENVNMEDIAISVIKIYKFDAALKYTTDLQKCSFWGYRENYYTVVSNIVDNARRYAATEIKITTRANYIEIYNDGPHIDEQFLNAQFRAYEKGSKGQFGLGMAIVKKTLDFFDMKLEVTNKKIGVSFKISKSKN